MNKKYREVFSADDFKNASNNIDDTSEHLSKGYRRSEEFIAREEAKQNRVRSQKKNTQQKSPIYNGDQPNQINIPHNQNRVSAPEKREDYIWQIPLGLLILFALAAWIAGNL